MTFASKAEESGLKKQKEEMLRINQEDNYGSMILRKGDYAPEIFFIG